MLTFYLNWLKFDIFYITCFPTHCRTSQLAMVSYNMIFYLKILRGCICDNLKPSFLPRLLFSWCTFSRRVTARCSRGSAKNPRVDQLELEK